MDATSFQLKDVHGHEATIDVVQTDENTLEVRLPFGDKVTLELSKSIRTGVGYFILEWHGNSSPPVRNYLFFDGREGKDG